MPNLHSFFFPLALRFVLPFESREWIYIAFRIGSFLCVRNHNRCRKWKLWRILEIKDSCRNVIVGCEWKDRETVKCIGWSHTLGKGGD